MLRKWPNNMELKEEMESNVNKGMAIFLYRYMEVFDNNHEVLHWDYQT